MFELVEKNQDSSNLYLKNVLKRGNALRRMYVGKGEKLSRKTW